MGSNHVWKKAGLDPTRVLDSITTGAAGSWSLSHLAPRMIKGDDAPGFYMKHFIKDMKIALEEADMRKLNMPGLELSLKLYKELATNGYEDAGTQALIKWYLKSNHKKKMTNFKLGVIFFSSVHFSLDDKC